MRILKTHTFLNPINSYLIDSPQPSNLSFLWNFGSLLGFSLLIQIVTGVLLAMHYNPSVIEAFNSVEHIMRDVNNGWLIRYLHSNTASAFFFLVYLHIGRGLYYGSYRSPRTLVWTIGTFIFILMMAIAFLGYTHSPKWCILFFSYLFFCIVLCLLSLIFFYLYSFQSSGSRWVKYIKIFMLFGLLFYLYKSITGQNLNSVESYGTFLINPNIVNRSDISAVDKSGSIVNSELITKFITEHKLNPVFIYEDLHLECKKRIIKKETENLSGIYLIFNKITEDYYIGSASNNRFYSRFYNHLLQFNGSKIVKLAVKKYKLKNFAFLILELFPEKVNKENNKRLLDLEDLYLKSLLPNYNILTEAGSSFGYRHTELSRIKMSMNYTLKRRDFIKNLNKNKEFTKMTKIKMKKSALCRGELLYTPQGILNMKKKSKPLIVFNLNRTVFGEYPSIIAAAESLNCDYKTIVRTLKTEKKILKKRFFIQYKKKR